MVCAMAERWHWSNGTQVRITSGGSRSRSLLQTYSSAIDSGVKLRPSEEELKIIGPDFTEHWQRVFVNAPDKPVLWLGSVCMYVYGHRGYGPSADHPPRDQGMSGIGLTYQCGSTRASATSSSTPSPSGTCTSPPQTMSPPRRTSIRSI